MSNETGAITLSPKQVTRIIARTIPAFHPTLVVGQPGCGKTDVITAAADEAGFDLIVSHPAVSDPTDFKGLPWMNAGEEYAEFRPFGEFARALRSTKPTVWFFDDLGQAPTSVQAAAMQLFLARRVGDHVLPKHVTLMAATNRRGDRAGVQGLLEPLKSRFTTIVEMAPNVEDWKEWAFTHDIAPEVIAFLSFRPALLSDFNPTQDIVNSPSPRTWRAVSDLVRLQLPRDVQLAAFGGAVGHGATTEFSAFLRTYQDMPDIEEILRHPDKGVVPTDPAVLYAVATALAVRADLKNFGRIATYAQRLYDQGKGEFTALMVLGAYRKERKIRSLPEWAKLAQSKAGKLILGTDD